MEEWRNWGAERIQRREVAEKGIRDGAGGAGGASASGYPEGLTGEHIPAAARIIAVADAYDAMSSNRSYREAMPQSRVREEIEHGLGTQFDPKYGKIMLEMIDEDTEYRLREGGGRPA